MSVKYFVFLLNSTTNQLVMHLIISQFLIIISIYIPSKGHAMSNYNRGWDRAGTVVFLYDGTLLLVLYLVGCFNWHGYVGICCVSVMMQNPSTEA